MYQCNKKTKLSIGLSLLFLSAASISQVATAPAPAASSLAVTTTKEPEKKTENRDIAPLYIDKTSTLNDYIVSQKNALIRSVDEIAKSNKKEVKPVEVVKEVETKKPIIIAPPPAPEPPEPSVAGIMKSSLSTANSFAEVRYLERVYLLKSNEMISNSGWIVGEITANSVKIFKNIPIVSKPGKKPKQQVKKETGKDPKKGATPVSPAAPAYNTITRVYQFPDVTHRMN